MTDEMKNNSHVVKVVEPKGCKLGGELKGIQKKSIAGDKGHDRKQDNYD